MSRELAATTTANPIKQRRQQAARHFALRVFLLLALISAIAYSAWFAPWSRRAPTVVIEAVP